MQHCDCLRPPRGGVGFLFGAPGCTPARRLRLAGLIVTARLREQKAINLPMLPKRSLALRRYTRLGTGPRTPTRWRLVRTPHLPSILAGAASQPLKRVPLHLTCTPRARVASKASDFSKVDGSVSIAVRSLNIRRSPRDAKPYFKIFSTTVGGKRWGYLFPIPKDVPKRTADSKLNCPTSPQRGRAA